MNNEKKFCLLADTDSADFGKIGQATKHLHNTVLFQRIHPFVGCLQKKFITAGLFLDHFLYPGRALHEFVDSHTPLVTTAGAFIASRGTVKRQIRAVLYTTVFETLCAIFCNQFIKFFM